MEIIDAELIWDQEYDSMGKYPVDRVETLLGQLDSMSRSKERGSSITDEIKYLSNKFVGQVKKIVKNLPKPMEWLSFLNHDLPLLLSTCREVQDTSIQHNLNKSQTRALAKLNSVSKNEFQPIVSPEPCS